MYHEKILLRVMRSRINPASTHIRQECLDVRHWNRGGPLSINSIPTDGTEIGWAQSGEQPIMFAFAVADHFSCVSHGVWTSYSQ